MVIPPNRLPRISRTIGGDVPMTPALQQHIAGDITGKTRIPSPFKWAGSKAKPHYLGPLRDAAQKTGAKRLLEPTLGGANIALNMPMREVAANDADAYLMNAYQQMRDAPGGLELDWKPWKGHGMTEGKWKGDEMPDPDRISKPTFLGPKASRGKYADYDGPVMRGITSGEDPGSFNAMIADMQAGEPIDRQRMAEMFMMNQQLSMNAWSRLNRKGQYNQSPGSLKIGEDKWNYNEYAPLMEHWTMSQSPLDDFLENVEADPLRDMAVLDPPYGGGEVGGYDYLDMMGGDAHKDLAEQLGGLAEDGLPIVAFNAATEADHYRDQGFRTLLNRRPDSTSSKASSRGIKPEMIAIANVPHMTADKWFQNHPTQRFGTQQGDVETWNQDPRFDEDFDPNLWKAHFFPNGDPQLSARRSIVNDLDELAGTLMKALRPEDKKNWGMPGQPYWWDSRYGGQMPKAVKYPWNKDAKGNYGPARPEDQFYGGGNMDIYDFMDLSENKDVLEQIIGTKGNRVKTDYPVEGREIVPWSEYMEADGIPEAHSMRSATAAAGNYGAPSKMEGVSVLDMPAIACETKTCGACASCYARQLNMANNPSQNRQYRNLDNVLTDMGKVTSALQESLYDNSRKFARGRGQKSKNRYKAAGDLKDAGELSGLTDMWNEQLPHELSGQDHWLATRQYPAVHDFLQGRNWKEDLFPENVNVKVSLPGNETRDSMARYEGPHADIIRDIISHPQISTTSYLEPGHKGEGVQVCPASEPGNPSECSAVIDPRSGKVGCSSCHSNLDIGYRHHGMTPKQQKQSMQGKERMKANFNWNTDPSYQEKVRGRRIDRV
jgi:site-specific DNA-adenine methylase